MGCASSTPADKNFTQLQTPNAAAGPKTHPSSPPKEQPITEQKATSASNTTTAPTHSTAAVVTTAAVAASPQEAGFGAELAKVISEATSGTKSKDAWSILYKCAELICHTFGFQTCSIVIYTASGLYCKAASNSASPMVELLQQHPDLIPAELMGWTTGVASSLNPTCIKAGDDAWTTLQRESLVDFTLLTMRGSCSSLAVLPLCTDQRCLGAIVLGHSQPLTHVLTQSWLSVLAPMLSLYVHDSHIIRTISLVEKIVEATTLNSLAYKATLELGDIFDWCHKEDIEARLVVLTPDTDQATVYCKLPPALHATDDRSSLVGRSAEGDSALTQSSRVHTMLEEGLLGTQMSVENTLTKRCLTGRQRLLFVADVMQALKLYGEPWKDIFFDSATVMTPSWVLAAPLVNEGKKLGAVLWLCSCRVNSEVLMRTASSYASPIIHALTRAVHCQLTGSAGGEPSDVGGRAAGTAGTAMSAVTSFTGLSSPPSSVVSRRSRGGGRSAYLRHSEVGEHSGAGETDDGGDGTHSGANLLTDIPVKYVLRHSPSTSALMRMYKSSIAQRAPAGVDDMSTGSVHEIRILSKAGEGAFGSVYVGRWRNIVVAVKIIKDNSGTRALKTAWELAVNKSLAHPSIVTVHAILTDVHLQKSSAKVLRFVPASALEAANVNTSNPLTPNQHSMLSQPPASGTGSAAATGVSSVSGPLASRSSTTQPGKAPEGAADLAVGTAGSTGGLAGAVTPATAPAPSAGTAPAAGGASGVGSCGAPAAGAPVVHTSGMGSTTPPAVAGAAPLPTKSSKPLTPKVHAILMEYCNLGGLHKYIDNRQFFKDKSVLDKVTEANFASTNLPPDVLHMDFILATLSEVASALQYLHAQGFVHCDLKPENVLLKEANNRRGFTAKLADFGLSELRTADGQVVGDLGGTVTHVAPESVLHRQVSTCSDMYAFGILMWELYSGQQPYRSLLSHISKREDRHRALLARVVHEGLRPVFPLGTPPDYLTMAQACWNADPTARPTTSEVIQGLEAMYAKYASPMPQGIDSMVVPA